MNPKKIEDLIKPTVEKTGCDKNLAQDLLSFFWAETRKALVEMKGHNIYVENIGTFRVKTWKIPELEKKYRSMIARYDERQAQNQMTFQRFAIVKELQVRLDRVTLLQEMIDKDKLKKQQVKEKRNAEEHSRDIETPQTDS